MINLDKIDWNVITWFDYVRYLYIDNWLNGFHIRTDYGLRIYITCMVLWISKSTFLIVINLVLILIKNLIEMLIFNGIPLAYTSINVKVVQNSNCIKYKQLPNKYTIRAYTHAYSYSLYAIYDTLKSQSKQIEVKKKTRTTKLKINTEKKWLNGENTHTHIHTTTTSTLPKLIKRTESIHTVRWSSWATSASMNVVVVAVVIIVVDFFV